MNSFDKVKKFMQEKDAALFKESKLHIFDEEMFDKDFNDAICLHYLDYLKRKVDKWGVEGVSDGTLCPWCYLYYTYIGEDVNGNFYQPSLLPCGDCGYGKKYGQCGCTTSRYMRICSEMADDVANIKGVQEAVVKLLLDSSL